MEDPAFDADRSVGGLGFGESVLDVGAQGVQRNPTFAVPLATAHLGAAEATRRGDADALATELHRRLDGLLHGAAEGDATLKLSRDVLGDELGVGLCLADLDDVEEDLVVGEPLDILLELLDASAALTNDDARTRRVDVDLALVGGPLDVDVANARVLKLLLDELLELEVLVEPLWRSFAPRTTSTTRSW